jgi:hypothetical protein
MEAQMNFAIYCEVTAENAVFDFAERPTPPALWKGVALKSCPQCGCLHFAWYKRAKDLSRPELPPTSLVG